MPSTPTYGLPYPALSDQPHGPLQVQALAEEVEVELARIDAGFLNAATAFTAALEATGSTTFVDLTTVGPSVTVTTRTKVLVMYMAQIFNTTSTASSRMSYAISGATTQAATISNAAIATAGTSGDAFQVAGFDFVTVNAGSNTFTAKYSAQAGSANFQRRRLFVWPL